MPVVQSQFPPRRNTVEVEIGWLEVVDEERQADNSDSNVTATAHPEPATNTERTEASRSKKSRKPIPRED